VHDISFQHIEFVLIDSVYICYDGVHSLSLACSAIGISETLVPWDNTQAFLFSLLQFHACFACG